MNQATCPSRSADDRTAAAISKAEERSSERSEQCGGSKPFINDLVEQLARAFALWSSPRHSDDAGSGSEEL